MSPANRAGAGELGEGQGHPSQLGYKKEQARAKRAPAQVTRKLGPQALLLPPHPFLLLLPQPRRYIAVRAFSGAKAGGREAPGTSDRGGECVYERGLLSVCCLWLCFASLGCSCRGRRRLPPRNAPPELHALPQPEFPPRLRDLLMLAGSPGGGKSHYYLARPRPPRKLPAPPPPRLVNGAPAPSHPVTGTRRHKERSKQGARLLAARAHS